MVGHSKVTMLTLMLHKASQPTQCSSADKVSLGQLRNTSLSVRVTFEHAVCVMVLCDGVGQQLLTVQEPKMTELLSFCLAVTLTLMSAIILTGVRISDHAHFPFTGRY